MLKIMINDYQNTQILIDKIKTHLPITAYPTKSFLLAMKHNQIKVEHNQNLEITDVIYLGDEGGIMCDIKLESNMVMASITQLNIQETHPLFKEIETYKAERIEKLKQVNLKNTPVKPKKKKKKKKK